MICYLNIITKLHLVVYLIPCTIFQYTVFLNFFDLLPQTQVEHVQDNCQ